MRAKSIVLIMIASGCGLIASIGISQVMERGAGKATANVDTEQIFVAMSDIDIGEELTAENVRLEEWPRDKIPDGVIFKLEDLEGNYPRTRLYPGEPILLAKLMDSNGDVDSLKIPEGYRAVSIKVTMDSSVSGLIQPGDRVDIMAFLRKGADIPKTMTRTILRDVRVFAINSETERSVDHDGNAIMAKTVSVLVKLSQVETLMLAHDLGQIRLSLRRPNDDGEPEDFHDGVADVDSLLGNPSEVADEEEAAAPTTDLAGGNGFLDFLQSQPEPSLEVTQPVMAPVPETEAIFMEVMTPDGTVTYRWHDPEQLPEEVIPGQLTAPVDPMPMTLPDDPDSGTNGDTTADEPEDSSDDEEPEQD